MRPLNRVFRIPLDMPREASHSARMAKPKRDLRRAEVGFRRLALVIAIFTSPVLFFVIGNILQPGPSSPTFLLVCFFALLFTLPFLLPHVTTRLIGWVVCGFLYGTGKE